MIERSGLQRSFLGGLCVAASLFAIPACAQNAPPLAFEVATVKPVDTSKIQTLEIRVYPGGRLVIHGYFVPWLIAVAFDLPEWEMVMGKEVTGGEKRVDKTPFDIEGKPSEELRKSMPDGEYSNFEIKDPRERAMLQGLLIERFHLKFHKESQPGAVYLLERGKGPLRLERVELSLYKKAEDGTVTKTDSYPTGDMGMVSGKHVSIHLTSMHQLAGMLSNIEEGPVTDQTGLPDFYNFKSQTVLTDEDFKGGGPMHLLMDAVPEMGLKLVKTKGTVEKFIVDSIDMPTDN